MAAAPRPVQSLDPAWGKRLRPAPFGCDRRLPDHLAQAVRAPGPHPRAGAHRSLAGGDRPSRVPAPAPPPPPGATDSGPQRASGRGAGALLPADTRGSRPGGRAVEGPVAGLPGALRPAAAFPPDADARASGELPGDRRRHGHADRQHRPNPRPLPGTAPGHSGDRPPPIRLRTLAAICAMVPAWPTRWWSTVSSSGYTNATGAPRRSPGNWEYLMRWFSPIFPNTSNSYTSATALELL